MSAMIEDAQIRMRYWAKAKQYLYDRDRLEIATEDQIASLADSLRYEDFRLATQPYVKQKERLITSFFGTQLDPLTAQMPKDLEDALAQWDEMIAIEARNFGFAQTVKSEQP